jgi:hypothetical protein
MTEFKQGEPAFYAHDGYLMTPERAKFLGFPLDSVLALYTTPQQRKPLTDEQMNALWFDTNKQHGSVIWRFARAIEAAHGIKE